MRLYLYILVSLSFCIASRAESSMIPRHRLQDGEESFTPAPTPSDTDGATSDMTGMDENENGGGDQPTIAEEFETPAPTMSQGFFGETPAPTMSQGFFGGTPAPTMTQGFFGETPAPTMSQGFFGETPAPTMSQGFFGETPAPTMTQGFGTPAPTMTQGFETPAPTMTQGFGTPSPTAFQGFETPAPTMMQWFQTPAPTQPYPAPVDPAPWEAEQTYTPRPEAVYVAADDDPLQPVSTGTEEDASWQWADSDVEDVEHDRTVLIALTVTFSVGVCLAILTAQQMIENPDGCCVSICRVLVALTCGITRCVCYPCRAMCGCTNPDRLTHEVMLQNDENYTHDLELN